MSKIVIVGGVAGGATAAARLRRLDESAEIVMFERGPHVSFANCGLPYYIGGDIADQSKLLLQTPESLKKRYNLDVRVQSEVVAIDRDAKQVRVRKLADNREYDEPYDKLILSPGAAPIRPPLSGIDHPRIFTLRNVPDAIAIKSVVDNGATSAIIVGGGFIGLEVAENFRQRELDVHVIEMLDQVMPPMDREMATAIHKELQRNKINLHLSDAVESFGADGERVTAQLKSGATLVADLVILAVGVRPESPLASQAGIACSDRGAIIVNEHMQTSDPDIYAVGDAVQVSHAGTGGPVVIPLAGPANRQGRIAADHITGRASTYRGTQGTSICRVFELVVASTGANEKMLKASGADYEKIYIHPAQHVGYYPGAQVMAIKLLFSKPDGKVLGAQITGGEGVDRRIDVIAMAIQAGMTVYDLEEVELAYSPQFGAAKDPVNMAGFVASNVLGGDVAVCHADAIPEDAMLLDVRTAGENAADSIDGELLIPIDELRQRHTELPTGKRLAVYCAVGMRGYTATRILTQLGYDAINLSGGMKTYRMFHP